VRRWEAKEVKGQRIKAKGRPTAVGGALRLRLEPIRKEVKKVRKGWEELTGEGEKTQS
jgi:hypothetical protein